MNIPGLGRLLPAEPCEVLDLVERFSLAHPVGIHHPCVAARVDTDCLRNSSDIFVIR